MRYTTEEIEFIDELYDEQMTYSGIAELCNIHFHNGKPVRTKNSINYIIGKALSDPRCLDLKMIDKMNVLLAE